jgi:hypothetical protein
MTGTPTLEVRLLTFVGRRPRVSGVAAYTGDAAAGRLEPRNG